MLADERVGVRRNARTAIVTGGAGGLGKATCEVLARDGYRVAVVDRDELGARAVADAIGGSAFACDVTDARAVATTFERAVETLGAPLDALATLAGVLDTTPFMELDAAAFLRVYETNVVGTFLCMREAVRFMQTGSRICTVASVAGKGGGGPHGTAAYAASKGAVFALTRNAAKEFAPLGIAVNGVVPGPVSTPLVGRPADPTEIAEAIAWLLSPAASYVHGELLNVDGGVLLD